MTLPNKEKAAYANFLRHALANTDDVNEAMESANLAMNLVATGEYVPREAEPVPPDPAPKKPWMTREQGQEALVFFDNEIARLKKGLPTAEAVALSLERRFNSPPVVPPPPPTDTIPAISATIKNSVRELASRQKQLAGTVTKALALARARVSLTRKVTRTPDGWTCEIFPNSEKER